jgi:hypothetical protein
MSKNGDHAISFKDIKEFVSVELALEKLYNCKLKKVNNVTIRGNCMLPSHPVGLSDESFSVNPKKQVWICHNTTCQKSRNGRKGGDVIELVAVMEKTTLRDAGIKLAALRLNLSLQPKEAMKDSPAPQSAENAEQNETKVMLEKYGVYAPLCDWIEQIEKSESDEYAGHLLKMILKKAEKLVDY